MSQENYFNKLKELPDSVRQFGGLIIITLIIILSFFILNNIFGEGDDLVLRMVAPGSSSIGDGDGFTGTYSCEDAGGPITEVTITAAGKNYSSGSWDASGGGQAKVGEHCSIVIFGATKNAPATGTGAKSTTGAR